MHDSSEIFFISIALIICLLKIWSVMDNRTILSFLEILLAISTKCQKLQAIEIEGVKMLQIEKTLHQRRHRKIAN